VLDAEGVPGQNKANPLSWFVNHKVVSYSDPRSDGIDTVVFDPSYGTRFVALEPADAQLNWENSSLAGFWMMRGGGAAATDGRTFIAKKRDITQPPETVWNNFKPEG
jgi:hypothetical protein